MILAPLLGIALQAFSAATVNVGSFHSSSANWFQPQIYVDLPATVYAVEGRTLDSYFFNVIRFDGDWTTLTNTVTSAKGGFDQFKWSYLPVSADAGTNNFQFNISFSSTSQLLFTNSFLLVTRAAAYPAVPVSRKLLIIGDSTTAGGTVSAQLLNIFSGDSKYTLTEVGPNTGVTADSNSVSRTVFHSGVSGWRYQDFYTNTTSQWVTMGGTTNTGSPYINSGGSFDFHYWLTNSGTTMSSGDWVIFNLGINGIFGNLTDAALAVQSGLEINAATNMIVNIASVVPGIRVGVALTIPPNQSTNAFVNDYGTSQTLGRYRLNNHEFVENILTTFGTGQFGVSLLPLNSNLDTTNNMFNGVHPASAGYWQIADTYRAFLKGME
jgi:lysophospholipase L1-like esterase